MYIYVYERIEFQSRDHLDSMNKQVEMISNLTALSVIVRNIGNKDVANKASTTSLVLPRHI